MVVNGGYPASLLCRSAVISWCLLGKKKKAVFNFHSSAIPPSLLNYLPERMIDLAIVSCSYKIVGVSDAILITLRMRLAFRATRKLSYIHNGIEDLKSQYLKQEQHENSYENKEYCLILATYQKYKGHEYALEAFMSVSKKHPNLKLYMFGYGRNFFTKILSHPQTQQLCS